MIFFNKLFRAFIQIVTINRMTLQSFVIKKNVRLHIFRGFFFVFFVAHKSPTPPKHPSSIRTGCSPGFRVFSNRDTITGKLKRLIRSACGRDGGEKKTKLPENNPGENIPALRPSSSTVPMEKNDYRSARRRLLRRDRIRFRKNEKKKGFVM